MFSSKPRVLILTHRIPFPPNRGDRIRAYHMVEFLSHRADVYLGSVSDEPWESSQREALEKLCPSVFFARLKSPWRWLRASAGFALGKSVTQGAFYSPQLADQVRLWSSEFRFDAAIMYCSSMGPYAKLMKTKPKRLVVDLVDVDSQKWDDYADVAYGPKKWLFRQEARRVGLLEESLSKSADAMTVVSPDEAQLFEKRHPGLQATSIGNGVDLRFFAPDALPFEKFSGLVPPSANPRLVFVGVLDYLPNVQGLQWFCDEVIPRLQSVFPSVSLDIVGRRPSGEVQALAKRSGVNLVGEVSDVRPYVLAAQIAIAPLQIARGVQNKVLEALACGKPVVASPQAATGIECSGGMSVVSQPADWVQAIVELQKPAHYAKMSACARSEVLEKYSWNAQLEPLLSLIGIA